MENMISERINALRKYYKLNVFNFADGCDVSNVTIFKLEKGGKISERSLLKIVACYGTTKEWLLSGKGEMLPFGPSEIAYDKIDGEEQWRERAYQDVEKKGLLMKNEMKKLWNILHKAERKEDKESGSLSYLSLDMAS